MKWPDELLKSFGIMQTEIVFVNPQKVRASCKNSDDRKIENVISITVQDGPVASQIHINYKIEDENDNVKGSLGAPIKEIRSIIVF